MAALAENKETIRSGVNVDQYVYGVAASATIYVGALVILASGYARPGRLGQGADNTAKAADAATYQAVGVCAREVRGTAVDGESQVLVHSGEFIFENASAGDAVTIAEIGKDVYILDDQTVAKTNPNNVRARAGKCVNVDASGVYVRVGPGV